VGGYPEGHPEGYPEGYPEGTEEGDGYWMQDEAGNWCWVGRHTSRSPRHQPRTKLLNPR
jgi:hypothetical protein